MGLSINWGLGADKVEICYALVDINNTNDFNQL